MTIDIPVVFASSDREFSVSDGDFSTLEIRDGNNAGFHYFYDTATRGLVTDFVLVDRPRVATLCRITLIKKGDLFTPRVCLWKKDKSKAGREAAKVEAPAGGPSRLIKAFVDTDDCHENFWKVINFIQSFREIEVPSNDFRVLPQSAAELALMLEGRDKVAVLDAVSIALGSSVTEADIALLTNRRGQLETFSNLLRDSDSFEVYKTEHGCARPEDVWQHFFESNQWIFGYGLSLISCESYNDAKLEQITSGSSVFDGGGKRSDAVLKSRGLISSLLFAEIKTHSTRLLAETLYRRPDVYRVTSDVSGAVSQIQKTVEKALRTIHQQFHRQFGKDGAPTGVEVSTVRPKQVLIVGSLAEFDSEYGVNAEKSMTFELYRRSITDVEIMTFDELHERARFIVEDM